MAWAKLRGQKWYGYYRLDGKEHTTGIGRATSAEAKSDAEKFEKANLDLANFDPKWTLRDYWTAMLRHMRSIKEPKPQTIDSYEREVARLILRYPIADMQYVKITDKDIEKWWNFALKVDHADHTESQRAAKRMMSLIMLRGYRNGHLWGISKWDGLTEGLKIRKTQKPEYIVMERDQFLSLVGVPKPVAHDLFLRGFIFTGCRPQEMHALMPEHFIPRTNNLNVCRAVVWHRGGLVTIDGVKDNEARLLDVDPEWVSDVQDFIKEHGIRRGQVIFSRDRMGVPNGGVDPLPDVDLSEEARAQLNPRFFQVEGRNFEHGTAWGYGGGKCRCEYCSAATRQYQRERRARSTTRRPSRGDRVRVLHRDPSINVTPRIWWTRTLRKYVQAAGIDWPTIEPYHFRHTFATWLAEGGVPVAQIRVLMGHANDATTLGYIHVRTGNTRAVEILSLRPTPRPAPSVVPGEPEVSDALVAAVLRRLTEKSS